MPQTNFTAEEREYHEELMKLNDGELLKLAMTPVKFDPKINRAKVVMYEVAQRELLD